MIQHFIPQLSTRLRIVIGLTSVLLSTMLAAVVFNLAPDPREAEVKGRGRLCEALAVNSSVLVSRDDIRRVQAFLSVLKARHEEIVSAGVRRNDGTLVVDVGDHVANWQPDHGKLSDDSQIFVPLRNGFEDWGSLELKFTPLRGNWWFEITHSSYGRLVVFIASICSLAWYWFLGRVLEQLSPSKAVPGRVRSALDTLAEGLLVLDRKGRIVLCNQSLTLTLGEDPEKLIGRPASKLPWIETSQQKPNSSNENSLDFPWIDVLSGQKASASSTLRLKDVAGRERICQVNCAPVFGNGSQIRGVVCSFEDVTVLESQKVELAEASRAKSEFLANMSHEIRTPMNAILGFTEVLRRGMYDNVEQRTEYLDTIHASGKHLLHLINDILDLSKVESGRMELEVVPCCPHEILLDVVNVLRVKAEEKGLALTAVTPGGLPEVITSDPGRLRQVLTNLIGNAIKFTERGSVKLVARFLSKPKSMIAIDIIDSGVGIPEKSLGKIFEPFVQADASVTRKFGGTGLGLTISKRFVEALGGSVTVTSTVGLGTTFTVTVPTGVLFDETRIIDISEVSMKKRHGRGQVQSAHYFFPSAKILLVDDGEANRQLIQLILQREGLLVDTAVNGQEAVDRATATAYDVIFMDMQMPVMDGYTATRMLRQSGHLEPIIALTANAMKGDEEKCLAAGCSDFLSKPVDLDELLNLLASLLEAEIIESIPESAPISRRLVTAETPLGPRVISKVAKAALTVAPTQEAIESSSAATIPSPAHEFSNHDATTRGLDTILILVEAELTNEGVSTPTPVEVTSNSFDAFVASETATGPLYSTLLMDDDEFREIVAGFIDKLRVEVDSLNDACERSNVEEIIRLSHWLKGAAGTMGFRDFTDPAMAILDRAREGRSDGIGPALDAINRLTARVAIPQTV